MKESKQENWSTEMTTAEQKSAVTWLDNKQNVFTIPETDYTDVDPTKLNEKGT